MTRGAGNRIDRTQPQRAVTPDLIQVRRCTWILRHGRGIWAWKNCGYLIIVSPGRRYWRPTRKTACSLAQRIRSQTIPS